MVPPTHELVDRRYDLAQLAPGDAAVAVYVVQLEGPSQFLVDAATQQSRQCDEEVLISFETTSHRS